MRAEELSRAEQIARKHKDLPTVTEQAVRERVAEQIAREHVLYRATEDGGWPADSEQIAFTYRRLRRIEEAACPP